MVPTCLDVNNIVSSDGSWEQPEAIIAQQQKESEGPTAALEKMSAQLELSKPAPQTVLNNNQELPSR